MKTDIKIPSLGESISEVSIGQILVKNGQIVSADAELLELETDKVNQLLYAPQAGIVALTVREGDTVKIGQIIGSIALGDGASLQTKGKPSVATNLSISVPSKAPMTPGKTIPPIEQSQESARRTKLDFAEELRTGQTRAIEAAPSIPFRDHSSSAETVSSPSSSIALGKETRQPLSKIRKVTAKRLVEAQHNTAMLTTFNEVDMSQIIGLREQHQEVFFKKYGTKLGFMSFFVEAVVSALKVFSHLNSYIEGDEMVLRNYYNIGIAVGAEKGTFVPVLRDADKMSFGEIEQAIANYAKKAREGKLALDDLQGGGFTITNGGIYGSLMSTPILNYPQSGILGMHKIEKRPVVVNEQIVIRPMMYLALSYDHRIVDGRESVSFLVHIKNILEDPARLLLNI